MIMDNSPSGIERRINSKIKKLWPELRIRVTALKVTEGELIDGRMKLFERLGKEARELLTQKDELYQKMADVVRSLSPLDSRLRTKHPSKCGLFDALLRDYPCEWDTTDYYSLESLCNRFVMITVLTREKLRVDSWSFSHKTIKGIIKFLPGVGQSIFTQLV